MTDKAPDKKRGNGKPKMDAGVTIMNIKAGRNKTVENRKNSRRKRRHKGGANKGQIITDSDESLDELLVNSESWSESSDEPDEHKGKVMLLQAWAPPRESEGHMKLLKESLLNEDKLKMKVDDDLEMKVGDVDM